MDTTTTNQLAIDKLKQERRETVEKIEHLRLDLIHMASRPPTRTTSTPTSAKDPGPGEQHGAQDRVARPGHPDGTAWDLWHLRAVRARIDPAAWRFCRTPHFA